MTGATAGPTCSRRFPSLNPATGDVVGEVPDSSAAEAYLETKTAALRFAAGPDQDPG